MPIKIGIGHLLFCTQGRPFNSISKPVQGKKLCYTWWWNMMMSWCNMMQSWCNMMQFHPIMIQYNAVLMSYDAMIKLWCNMISYGAIIMQLWSLIMLLWRNKTMESSRIISIVSNSARYGCLGSFGHEYEWDRNFGLMGAGRPIGLEYWAS